MDGWWFALAALIRSRPEVELPGFGRFACPDLASKRQTFSLVETAIHRDYGLLGALRATIKCSNIDCGALVGQEGLTEEQLRQLSRHPLVTIGSHAATHSNLALLSAAEVRREMTTSRKYLEDLTGKPVVHFAYPYGNPMACGKREAEISSAAGFRTSVTTRHGAIFPDHLSHLHALPRISIWSHDTSSTLRCKLDGLYRAYHSRLGDPVVWM